MLAGEIDGFVASLMLERSLSANTCSAYASDLGFFRGYLEAHGVTSVAAIAREHIVGFLRAERETGLRDSTRARRTAAIRMWLRYLKERKLIPHNPSDLMDTPKKALVLPRVLSEEEVARMLDAVAGAEPRELRDRAMLEVMYGCGLRVSEVCSLGTDDVVAEGELLRVFGKGSKERLVPIGHAAGRALVAYLEGGRAAFAKDGAEIPQVFVTRLGKPFTRQGVFKIIKQRAAAVGIASDRISPHVLRHCFASHMLAHGADIRAIQEMLGHADIGTTQVYTHIDTAKFGEIHRKYHPRAE